MRKLTEVEFDSIVNSVAKEMSEVLDVSVQGFKVEATFKSNSGKSTWDSLLDFDEMTGKYTYTRPFLGAALPWVFGNSISDRIKELLNN